MAKKPPRDPNNTPTNNESGFRKNKPTRGLNGRIPGSQVSDAVELGSKTKVPSGSNSSVRDGAPNNSNSPLQKGGDNSLGDVFGTLRSQNGVEERASAPKTPTQDGKSIDNPSIKQQNIGSKASGESTYNQGAKFQDGPSSELESDLSQIDANANMIDQEARLPAGERKSKNKDEADLKLDKDNALSVKYRIPKKLARLYSDEPEKLKKLSDWFFKQLTAGEQDRMEYLEQRLPKFRNVVINFVTAGLQEVFEGSHNIHVPLAFEKCKAMHARISQAIFGIDPMFSLKPRTNVASTFKEAKEQLLSFIVKSYINNRQGIYNAIDQDIWNFVSDGTAVTRHAWQKDVRKFTDIEVEINARGEEEEVETEREEVIFDGPILGSRPLENLYLIGDKYDDADSLDILADKQRYTKSDIVKLTQQGFFHKDTVEMVFEEVAPTTYDYSGMRDTEIHKFLKEITTGMQQVHRESGIKGYNIFEAYVRYDIDDDGIDEELVFWVEEMSRKILRITYLERVGPGGKRPYVIKRFFPREGTPYGIGLGEMLFGVNNEIDYLHNMRLDSAVFQVMPFFFYRKTSSVGDQKVKMNIAPGKGIGLEDVNDVSFPRPTTNLGFTYQEEQNIRQIADGVSSISPLSMGQVSGQGATRTATGTAALVAAADALIDISIKRYQQGFKKNLEIIDKQVMDLLPLGTAIRVTGVDGQEMVKIFANRKNLRFDVDFELEANSANSNKAIERELAATTFHNSLNPILIQTGVVGPDQIKNSYVRYLKSLEVKNIHDFVANYDESMRMPSLSGKDELTMILFGIKPQVRLNDRHAEKLAFFDEFENSPDFGLFDTDEQVQMYAQVKREHQDALAAMAAQASQVAQSGIVSPMESAGIAAGAGNPTGQVAQQQSDLTGEGFGAQ